MDLRALRSRVSFRRAASAASKARSWRLISRRCRSHGFSVRSRAVVRLSTWALAAPDADAALAAALALALTAESKREAYDIHSHFVPARVSPVREPFVGGQ